MGQENLEPKTVAGDAFRFAQYIRMGDRIMIRWCFQIVMLLGIVFIPGLYLSCQTTEVVSSKNQVDTLFIIHKDTVYSHDTTYLIYRDTLYQRDSVFVSTRDTIITKDTLIVRDTLHSTQTIVTKDTVFHLDTMVVVNRDTLFLDPELKDLYPHKVVFDVDGAFFVMYKAAYPSLRWTALGESLSVPLDSQLIVVSPGLISLTGWPNLIYPIKDRPEKWEAYFEDGEYYFSQVGDPSDLVGYDSSNVDHPQYWFKRSSDFVKTIQQVDLVWREGYGFPVDIYERKGRYIIYYR